MAVYARRLRGMRRASFLAAALLLAPWAGTLAATGLELEPSSYKDPDYGYEFRTFRRWPAIPRKPGEATDWLRAWADGAAHRLEIYVWTEPGETPEADPKKAAAQGLSYKDFCQLHASFIPFIKDNPRIEGKLDELRSGYNASIKLKGKAKEIARSAVLEGYQDLLGFLLEGLDAQGQEAGFQALYASEREAAARLDPKQAGFPDRLDGFLKRLGEERGMARHLYNLRFRFAMVPFSTEAGAKGRRYDGIRKDSVCTAYEVPFRGRTIGLLFHAPAEDLKRFAPLFESCARSLEADARWTPPAQGAPLQAAATDPRAVAKAAVLKTTSNVPGWWHLETPHYILVTNLKEDSAFPGTVVDQIEAMRRIYERLIPTEKPIRDVSIVRICKARSDYLDYGAPPESAGYWSSRHKELVLCGPEAAGKTGEEASLATMRHEAFHQYLFYAMRNVHSHTWLDEGTAEFFAGGKVTRDGATSRVLIGECDRRNGTISAAISNGRHIPLKDFVDYTQQQYYAPDTMDLCYAEGWALVYFLLKGTPEGSPWRRIIPTYLATLHEKGDPGAANRAAFQGVDFTALEAEWAAFYKNMSLRSRIAKSDLVAPILEKPVPR